MIRFFLALSLTIFTTQTNAEWVKDNTVVEVDTTDPNEMSHGLGTFTQIRDYLNAENLVQPSKVVVKLLRGDLSNYRWENDENCKVDEPSKVPHIQLASAYAEYIFAEKPDALNGVLTGVGVTSPCFESVKKPFVKKK